MSEIKGTELQYMACKNVPNMHIAAVLLHGLDGWRCYVAAIQMPGPEEGQEAFKTAMDDAFAFAMRSGHKVHPEHVSQYFPMDYTKRKWA